MGARDELPEHKVLPPAAQALLRAAAATPEDAPLARVIAVERAVSKCKRQFSQYFKKDVDYEN